ncbi:hypothetical protein OB955_21920 [Halobacteria archaeon AArc-m2/3/4]|uniref:Uncharacterized protein n=1 Tax=Natronoglomus mannanivorans TaxID=2979990 RepID=A0ABT2QK88_9EURY|nr:hypothetical protein [Halobacteria archaeon AArc-m2/3/4]
MLSFENRDELTHHTFTLAVYGLPVAGVLGVVVPLLLGSKNFSVLGLYLAIPMIFTPFVVNSFRVESVGPIQLHQLDWKIPSILIHVLVSVMIYQTATSVVRPTSFYVAYAAAYGLLFLLLLSQEPGFTNRIVGLYHLCLLVLLLIFSVTLNYFFFIGRTDLPPHVAMMMGIYEEGLMPELWEIYQPFQLWHIYTGAVYGLADGWITPYTTMVLLSGLIFAAGVTMMFALSYRIYPNERVSMLACLILIAIPEYFFYGMYSISRSITSILFVLLLFTLVCGTTKRIRALRMVLITGLILYHTITIPFLLLLLGVLYFVERLFDERPYVVDNYTITIMAAISALYWTFHAGDLTVYLIEAGARLGNGLREGTGVGEETPSSVFISPWIEVINYTPYSFLLFFVILGFLFWFVQTHNPSIMFSAFAATSVLMVPVLYPGPALLLDSLVGVNLERFAHYGFMFTALTSGFGIYALVKRGGIKAIFVMLLILTCFSFVAVSNDFVASDNPLVERPFYTYYLTEQEDSSFERIHEIHEGNLTADHITCRYVENIYLDDCSGFILENNNIPINENDGVVIREGELERRPLRLEDGNYVNREMLPWDQINERDRVHDSGAVTYYSNITSP